MHKILGYFEINNKSRHTEITTIRGIALVEFKQHTETHIYKRYQSETGYKSFYSNHTNIYTTLTTLLAILRTHIFERIEGRERIPELFIRIIQE